MSATTLAKHRAILEILANRPDLERKYYQFRNCLHHISYYISLLYSRNQDTQTLHLRCPLKHRCPKCMDVENIKAARKLDFRTILKAAQSLGAGERGEGSRVWWLRWESSRRRDGKTLSKALSRADKRYRPLMSGAWGGELVRTFRAITESNGPKGGTSFVFNSLVLGAPDAELDEDGLNKRLPNLLIRRFHGHLELGWITYLQSWSNTQLTHSTPDAIVEWMTSKSRMFESLGALRGVRSQETTEYTTKLHSVMGKAAQLGFFDRLSLAEEVLARIEYNLPLVASNLLDRVLSDSDLRRIMSMVKPQVRTALNPPMEELAKELAALKERVEAIERVIGPSQPQDDAPKWEM